MFIPSLGVKREFAERLKGMSEEERKMAEFKRLEISRDTFPTSIEEAKDTPFLWFTKMEFPEQTRISFYKRPDFVVEDIFYDVMNGVAPKEGNL